jgi:putative transposase
MTRQQARGASPSRKTLGEQLQSVSEASITGRVIGAVLAKIQTGVRALARRLREVVRPGLGVGFVRDAFRSRAELLAENALLRQQLIVAARRTKKPQLRRHERATIVVLAAMTRTWRDALLLVRPETVLRWHREGLRIFWRRRSRHRARPTLDADVRDLIRRMALENRLWGAERLRGELLKLGIHVSKRTVQKYMRQARGPTSGGQTWSTFLRNHMHGTWACDFLPLHDVWFRPLYAFFIVHLGSRRVVHVGVTRNPSATWVAQQLREATPPGHAPRFLIRDNDHKFGAEFDRAAQGVGARVLRIAVRQPRMNAFCERFIGSVRRECLDHIIILGERHLLEVLPEYVAYFNESRVHQGIGQLVPAGTSTAALGGEVVAVPVLRGLHHEYRRAA